MTYIRHDNTASARGLAGLAGSETKLRDSKEGATIGQYALTLIPIVGIFTSIGAALSDNFLVHPASMSSFLNGIGMGRGRKYPGGKPAQDLATAWYRRYLLREPDAAGLTHWMGQIIDDGPQWAFRNFSASDEYWQKGAARAAAGNANGLGLEKLMTTPEQVVLTWFRLYLQRDPDLSGFYHWIGELSVDGPDKAFANFQSSVEFQARVLDAKRKKDATAAQALAARDAVRAVVVPVAAVATPATPARVVRSPDTETDVAPRAASIADGLPVVGLLLAAAVLAIGYALTQRRGR